MIMQTALSAAIEALAAAYIAEYPDVKSSDKAFNSILFEFRNTFLRLKAPAPVAPVAPVVPVAVEPSGAAE